jgi:hypothetical protein
MKLFIYKTIIDRNDTDDCNILVLISLQNESLVAYYLVKLMVKEIK